MKIIDYTPLIGKKIGKLTIIDVSKRLDYKNGGGSVVPIKAALCKCDCGASKIISIKSLNKGRSHSCGCIVRKHGESVLKDGKSTMTKEYKAWHTMKSRCSPRIRDKKIFENYAGRGITVCDRWKNDYQAFLGDMGRMPTEGRWTLDRIDNNQGYSKENCRWATYKEQMNNTRATVHIEYQGVDYTVSALSEKLNIKKATLYDNHRRHIHKYPNIDVFLKDRFNITAA